MVYNVCVTGSLDADMGLGPVCQAPVKIKKGLELE